jgi:hypothetical protein
VRQRDPIPLPAPSEDQAVEAKQGSTTREVKYLGTTQLEKGTAGSRGAQRPVGRSGRVSYPKKQR